MSARIDRARGASALACVALLLTPFGAAGAPKEPTLAVRCGARQWPVSRFHPGPSRRRRAVCRSTP